mmetsp:Transcript_34794/g.96074  ORF Transcript_34794/g.96074 Transcript_34794/m.96074 type:complete len:205 (+) Transcript_34794:285-899(+)
MVHRPRRYGMCHQSQPCDACYGPGSGCGDWCDFLPNASAHECRHRVRAASFSRERGVVPSFIVLSLPRERSSPTSCCRLASNSGAFSSIDKSTYSELPSRKPTTPCHCEVSLHAGSITTAIMRATPRRLSAYENSARPAEAEVRHNDPVGQAWTCHTWIESWTWAWTWAWTWTCNDLFSTARVGSGCAQLSPSPLGPRPAALMR